MPSAPLRPCLAFGCGQLARAGRCEAHGGARKPWQPSATRPPIKRLRGEAGQQRRQRLFQRSPICVQCEREGRTIEATRADHVIPLAEGGPDTEANLQALCACCYGIKTADESRRGVMRGW